jgi:hypothetical protein
MCGGHVDVEAVLLLLPPPLRPLLAYALAAAAAAAAADEGLSPSMRLLPLPLLGVPLLLFASLDVAALPAAPLALDIGGAASKRFESGDRLRPPRRLVVVGRIGGGVVAFILTRLLPLPFPVLLCTELLEPGRFPASMATGIVSPNYRGCRRVPQKI